MECQRPTWDLISLNNGARLSRVRVQWISRREWTASYLWASFPLISDSLIGRPLIIPLSANNIRRATRRGWTATYERWTAYRTRVFRVSILRGAASSPIATYDSVRGPRRGYRFRTTCR